MQKPLLHQGNGFYKNSLLLPGCAILGQIWPLPHDATSIVPHPAPCAMPPPHHQLCSSLRMMSMTIPPQIHRFSSIFLYLYICRCCYYFPGTRYSACLFRSCRRTYVSRNRSLPFKFLHSEGTFLKVIYQMQIFQYIT